MTFEDQAVNSAFHNIGCPDANDLIVKSRLIRFVTEEIRRRALTQEDAGKLLDLNQSNVSPLMNEKLSRFSIQKLMGLVARLGFKVSIHVEGAGIDFDVPSQHAARVDK